MGCGGVSPASVSAGIDVLYLQPITKSYSNHKYDTIDYKQLDSQYGTDADFKTLSDKVHDKGLLTVLSASIAT